MNIDPSNQNRDQTLSQYDFIAEELFQTLDNTPANLLQSTNFNTGLSGVNLNNNNNNYFCQTQELFFATQSLNQQNQQHFTSENNQLQFQNHQPNFSIASDNPNPFYFDLGPAHMIQLNNLNRPMTPQPHHSYTQNQQQQILQPQTNLDDYVSTTPPIQEEVLNPANDENLNDPDTVQPKEKTVTSTIISETAAPVRERRPSRSSSRIQNRKAREGKGVYTDTEDEYECFVPGAIQAELPELKKKDVATPKGRKKRENDSDKCENSGKSTGSKKRRKSPKRKNSQKIKMDAIMEEAPLSHPPTPASPPLQSSPMPTRRPSSPKTPELLTNENVQANENINKDKPTNSAAKIPKKRYFDASNNNQADDFPVPSPAPLSKKKRIMLSASIENLPTPSPKTLARKQSNFDSIMPSPDVSDFCETPHRSVISTPKPIDHDSGTKTPSRNDYIESNDEKKTKTPALEKDVSEPEPKTQKKLNQSKKSKSNETKQASTEEKSKDDDEFGEDAGFNQSPVYELEETDAEENTVVSNKLVKKKFDTLENVLGEMKEILHIPLPDPLSGSAPVKVTEAAFQNVFLEYCATCHSSLRKIQSDDNNFVNEIAAKNMSNIAYPLYQVTSPKFPYIQYNLFDERELFQLFITRTSTPGQLRRLLPENGYLTPFEYHFKPEFLHHMFIIYSTTCRLHYCMFVDYKIYRESELHRKGTCLKRLFRCAPFSLKEKVCLAIFSYQEDVYFEFEADDFFVANKKTEKDVRYIMRLRKSTPTMFNYLLTTADTIKNFKIYGTYNSEQIVLGKVANIKVPDLVTDQHTGNKMNAMIHSYTGERRDQIKQYGNMEYAVYKFNGGENSRRTEINNARAERKRQKRIADRLLREQKRKEQSADKSDKNRTSCKTVSVSSGKIKSKEIIEDDDDSSEDENSHSSRDSEEQAPKKKK